MGWDLLKSNQNPAEALNVWLPKANTQNVNLHNTKKDLRCCQMFKFRSLFVSMLLPRVLVLGFA